MWALTHCLALSEQNKADSVFTQPMNSGTDSEGNWPVFSSGQSRLLPHALSKTPFGGFIFDTEKHRFNIYFMPTKAVKETL